MKLLLLATAANALRAPTSMSVAVFGATGLTGRECTHQLLERGVPVRALGGKTKDVGPTMLTDDTSTVIAAMKKYDVKRVAVVTSIGAGDSKDQAPFMFKMLMMTVMSSIFADKNNQEALFTDGGVGRDLKWCIVRPGGLTVEKPTD